MDLAGFMNSIVSFAHTNTVIALILALVLLFFMYRKPKLFFTLLFLGLFLVGMFYLITNMASSGSEQKKRLISDEEKQLDNDR